MCGPWHRQPWRVGDACQGARVVVALVEEARSPPPTPPPFAPQVKGKSKYGVPIFLPNGNVNPAYLAAERKEAQAMSKKNQQTSEAKRKALISKKEFELADYVRKKIGNVGSGKDYYSSGR